MTYLLALLGAALVGVCASIEPAVNSGLGKVITPRLATLHSFIVGLLVMLLINVVSGSFKEYRLIAKAPPYLWIGGLLGTTIVYVGAKVTPILGVASTITLMVAAQMICSMLIDSFGLFGTARVPLDMGRIAGILLMVVAVKLIVK